MSDSHSHGDSVDVFVDDLFDPSNGFDGVDRPSRLDWKALVIVVGLIGVFFAGVLVLVMRYLTLTTAKIIG